MAKRKTNVQLVKSIMENSNYGALAQLFVMDALYKFSNKVAAANPSEAGNFLVDGAAWVGVAKEIQAKLAANAA